MRSKQEEILQERVATYLTQNYPDVLFHSDYGSGANLTIGQAVEQKRLNGGQRAWPDMVIAEPRVVYTPVEDGKIFEAAEVEIINGQPFAVNGYPGLYLELKKDDENIYAQRKLDDPDKLSLDGKIYANKHIREQADVLYKLRQAGYCAEFAIGYEQAISIITDYLGKPQKPEVEF